MEFDFAVEECHNHQVVAGEKLATGDYDHGETCGKDTGASDFAAVDVAEGSADASRRDKHTSENAE